MVYIAEAKPGFLRHTFSMLRKTFPNLVLHKIINEAIFPFRVELVRRTEGGGESIVTDSLRVYMMDNLLYLSNQIKDHANTVVFDPEVSLVDMKAQRDAFVNRMLDKEITPEEEVRRKDWSHSDELLEASDNSFHSITANIEGDRDLDFAQPTRERIQNPLIREVIIALDRLVVVISTSHSADNPRTILAEEAARWNNEVLNIYALIDNFDPSKAVFHPSAMSLNERENGFNANGEWDVPSTKGTATGEVANNPRLDFDQTVQDDFPKSRVVNS